MHDNTVTGSILPSSSKVMTRFWKATWLRVVPSVNTWCHEVALPRWNTNRVSFRCCRTIRHSRTKFSDGSSSTSIPMNTEHDIWMLAGTTIGFVPLASISQIKRTIWTSQCFGPPLLTTGRSFLVSSWIVCMRSRAVRCYDSFTRSDFTSSSLSLVFFSDSWRLTATVFSLASLVFQSTCISWIALHWL